MRAVLAAEKPLFRTGLRYVLERELGATAVEEVATLDETVSAARDSVQPDVVLVDLELPGLKGLDGLRDLRRRIGGVPFVVLGSAKRRQDILQSIDGGAHGFIPETAPLTTVIEALRLVLSGNIYVPPNMLIADEPAGSSPAPALDETASPATPTEIANLTPRQQQVLELLVRGQSNREIAHHLGVAQGTVRIHVAAILRTLNVRNRTQAALTAVHSRSA